MTYHTFSKSKFCSILLLCCFLTLYSRLSKSKILNFQHAGKFSLYTIKNFREGSAPSVVLKECKNTSRLKHSKLMMERNRKRVLCTGIGVINGVGVGIHDFWNSLIEGKNVIDKVNTFDTTNMNCQIGCQVSDSDFDATQWYRDKKEAARNDRYANFAMCASRMAMDDAKIDSTKLNPEKFGVIIGSGIGGIGFMEKECETLMKKGNRRVSPYLIPAMIANTASGIIAIQLNAQGPNHSVVSACASAGHAIGVALRYMQEGKADIMICGGAEASITPLSFAGFNALRAMCTGYNDNPKKGSRPFDSKRAGFVMGEGAGVMILETEEHALKRGASNIYCEVAGYGANCDAYHVTMPRPNGAGLAKCLELAIEDANVEKEDIGYINAHGTSTPYNDKFETMAFKAVFGEELSKRILISSTKSMTGHCLGAAGGIEACIAAKVLETGLIPPTINYEFPDPECDLNYCPNKAVKVEKPFKAVLSDTLGFGGHNAALVLKRFPY